MHETPSRPEAAAARPGHSSRTARPRLAPLAAALLLLPAAAPAAATGAVLDTVEVVGTAPVPGAGIERDRLPYSVYTARPEDIESAQAASLPELLNGRLPSVQLTDTTGNAFQPELSFRGFQASPLLGAAQGLSVFLDGMRLNEPFGDIVHFDLIPLNAIDRVTLVGGSQPAFGLNTLGGALSLTTKSGRTLKDGEIDLTAGAHGRRGVEFEQGGVSADGRHDWYAAGNVLKDGGWRRHSPSDIRQAFGKWGTQDADGRVEVMVGGADNRLVGNGLLPRSFFAADRRGYYTRPDITENAAAFAQAAFTRALAGDAELTGRVSLRAGRTIGRNGDLNEIEADRLGLEDYADQWDDCIGGGGTPASCTTSLAGSRSASNRMTLRQDSVGAALQWASGSERSAAGRWQVGGSVDHARMRLGQATRFGDFSNARSTLPDGDTFELTRLAGRTTTWSSWVSRTSALTGRTGLNLAARANLTQVTTDDRWNDDLDGNHRFASINPSAGLTHALSATTTVFGGWSRGTRVPTPIELGCANPDEPCLLPNAMQADPPLSQVKTDTFELGARARLGASSRLQVTAFRARNRDDILFVLAPGSSSHGYFQNVGATRRQGLETLLAGRNGPVDWSAGWTLLDATFQTDATFAALGSPSGQQVRPGDRLPGVSRNVVKLSADWRATPRWLVGAQWQAFSGRNVLGNENGRQVDDDGQRARVAGWSLLNLHARYRVAPRVELFGRVNNVLDRRYATGGALAPNAFAGGAFNPDPADWRSELFLAPGAPRIFQAGVRVEL